eukprot:7885821-Heterocapsa_arctica.AAC.1
MDPRWMIYDEDYCYMPPGIARRNPRPASPSAINEAASPPLTRFAIVCDMVTAAASSPSMKAVGSSAVIFLALRLRRTFPPCCGTSNTFST